ncbi:hypothetical protein [Moraxella lacunata]|uniref:hypothetical protein n=1 Tax=Moraxella lacunata TaxID=477 RepID=UPI003EE10119
MALSASVGGRTAVLPCTSPSRSCLSSKLDKSVSLASGTGSQALTNNDSTTRADSDRKYSKRDGVMVEFMTMLQSAKKSQ